jgi:hypothetical protein
VSATRLAPVSRQGFAPQILAEQFIHFIRELLYFQIQTASLSFGFGGYGETAVSPYRSKCFAFRRDILSRYSIFR